MSRILCIEGDETLRLQIFELLTGAGYDCVTVATGEEGLGEAAARPPALVLLEVVLDDMNGFDLLEKLRQMPLMRGVPMLFHTAATHEDDVLRAYELGAEDYISKPMRPAVLLARVRIALSRRPKEAPPKLPLDRAPDAVCEAAENPNQIFSKYVLMQVLGQGGMGKVYQAWDSRLNTMVALKFLRTGQVANRVQTRRTERFFREAQTVIQLTHPNICRVYDLREEDGRLYISMQFIDGESVNRRFPPITAARLIQPIAEALEDAHQHGITHRDIKPTNVFVDRAGKPYIMDFGLARTSLDPRLTPARVVVGSPSYMSPEQAAGQRNLVGPTSDIYSLGATLYKMITGWPPYLGNSAYETIKLVYEGRLIPPCEHDDAIPRRLERICLKAMSREPAGRYATAKLLARDLKQYLMSAELEGSVK